MAKSIAAAYSACSASSERFCSYELLLPKRTSLRHRVPAADDGFLDFLSYLLTPDPTQRPSAEEALQHPWLRHPYPPAEQIPD
jgi:serine/threonine protein kinase